MKRVIMKLRMLFVLLAICAVGVLNIQAQKKDKVIATKNIQGMLLHFEVGDYVHAVIKTSTGKKKYFFIKEPGVDYFLALHKGKKMQLTYQISDTYFQEAEGVLRVEGLIAAKYKNQTSEKWMNQEMKKFRNWDDFNKKYDALVDKYTK